MNEETELLEQHFADLRAEGIIKIFGLRLVDVAVGKAPHYAEIDKAYAESVLASLPEQDAHDLICVCALPRDVWEHVVTRSLDEMEKIRMDAFARFQQLRNVAENGGQPRPRPGTPDPPAGPVPRPTTPHSWN